MEFPAYMDYFSTSYSPEFVEILSSIEASLSHLNYDKHQDLIDVVFMKEGVEPLRALCDTAVGIYRIHLADALRMQGFSLINYEEEKLKPLSDILLAVTILGSKTLEEALDGDSVQDMEDDLSWICEVIGIILDVPAVEMMQYIDGVEPYVMDILQDGEVIEEWRRESSEKAQARFLAVMDGDKSGIMVDEIRKLNYFGYDVNVVGKLVEDEIEKLEDVPTIIRELKLLLAGSSMTDIKKMRVWAEDTVEALIHNPRKVLDIHSKLGDFEDMAL